MHKALWIISCFIWPVAGNCQEHGSFEQLYYAGSGTSVIVPKLYYQTRHDWFGEVRYNHEELQTVSFNAGKMFSNKKLFAYSVTPYAGIILGRMNGGTIGSNIDMEYKSLFFSLESKYSEANTIKMASSEN